MSTQTNTPETSADYESTPAEVDAEELDDEEGASEGLPLLNVVLFAGFAIVLVFCIFLQRQ